jgi:hypothetical protein
MKGQDKIIKNIERRVAQVTMIPEGEAIVKAMLIRG